MSWGPYGLCQSTNFREVCPEIKALQTRAEKAEAEVERLAKLAKRAEDFDAGWWAGERGDPQAAGASADWKDGWDFSRALDAVDRLTAALSQIAARCDYEFPKTCATCTGSLTGHPDCGDDTHDPQTCDQYIARAALKGDVK